MTEYGGARFASYYFAEYLNMLVVSGIVDDDVLRRLAAAVRASTRRRWVDPFVVLVKMSFVVVFFIWIRATLPRLRYDQLMSSAGRSCCRWRPLNALVTAIIVVVVD